MLRARGPRDGCSMRSFRRNREHALKVFFPFLPEFLRGVASGGLPGIIAVLALADGGVQVCGQLRVVLFGNPVQKIGADSITGVVSQREIAPSSHPNQVRAMTLRFELEPTEVIGHSLEIAADRGALLGLPGTVVTQLRDARDLLIDIFRHVTLLL